MPNSSSFVRYKLLLPSALPRLSQPYMLLWVRCPSLTATTFFAHSSLCGTASFSALCLQIEIVGVIKVGRGSRAIEIVFIVVHSCESFSLKNDDNKSNNAKHVAALLFYEQRSKHEGGEDGCTTDDDQDQRVCTPRTDWSCLSCLFSCSLLAWSWGHERAVRKSA